jgi:hypothetical protein
MKSSCVLAWQFSSSVSRYRLVCAALQLKGGRPMPTIAAPTLTADRIDYWIPPHIIQYCYGTHPPQSKFIPRGGRRVGMLAIGKCLKDQYDSLATPAPPHLSLHSSRNSKNGDSRSARHRAAYAPQMHFASSTDSSISGGSAKALLSSNFIFESCVIIIPTLKNTDSPCPA